MRWRLKSPASRLFTQPFIHTQTIANIKAPRHWPFVRGIHRGPVNSPHKWPVTRKMFPFDDVIMRRRHTYNDEPCYHRFRIWRIACSEPSLYLKQKQSNFTSIPDLNHGPHGEVYGNVGANWQYKTNPSYYWMNGKLFEATNLTKLDDWNFIYFIKSTQTIWFWSARHIPFYYIGQCCRWSVVILTDSRVLHADRPGISLILYSVSVVKNELGANHIWSVAVPTRTVMKLAAFTNSGAPSHSHESNFTASAQTVILSNELANYPFHITATSPRCLKTGNLFSLLLCSLWWV